MLPNIVASASQFNSQFSPILGLTEQSLVGVATRKDQLAPLPRMASRSFIGAASVIAAVVSPQIRALKMTMAKAAARCEEDGSAVVAETVMVSDEEPVRWAEFDRPKGI